MRGAGLTLFPLAASFCTLAWSPQAAVDIRREALAEVATESHPLPLAGSWEPSTQWAKWNGREGLSPEWQMEMIDRGHHLLPWFHIPEPGVGASQEWVLYFEKPLMRAAELGLPISFIGTQWEDMLKDPPYLGVSPEENPNVVSVQKEIVRKISPFGKVSYWRDVGGRWASGELMRWVQQLCPDLPLVIFISNNEAARLTWSEAEQDRRYLARYGEGKDANCKRRIFSKAWEERYGALMSGFREGLTAEPWRRNAVFVGYEAFGPRWFGRWSGWKQYSLYVPGRVDPNPLFWGGGSPSYYLEPWSAETDYRVFSPQVAAMNWVFMLEEARASNPRFWFEVSTWDGGARKREFFESIGQDYTPERYGGFVQFGMWLMRPRVVRDYRDYGSPRTETLPWITQVIAAVDRVYANPVLTDFWRHSTLVENRSRPHPYNEKVPGEYVSTPRMFLLTTNLDPPQPWTLETELPVFALARVQGEPGARRWLLYCHSPLKNRANIAIQVPGFGPVLVDAPVAGAFYLVQEPRSFDRSGVSTVH